MERFPLVRHPTALSLSGLPYQGYSETTLRVFYIKFC